MSFGGGVEASSISISSSFAYISLSWLDSAARAAFAFAASILAATLALAFLNFDPLPSKMTLRGPLSNCFPCNVSTAFLAAASAPGPENTTRPNPSPVPVTGCLSIMVSRMSPHPAKRISRSKFVVMKDRWEIRTACCVMEFTSRY